MGASSIAALPFPEGAEEEIERRFANRAKGVDQAEGFQSFELLRPKVGGDPLLRRDAVGFAGGLRGVVGGASGGPPRRR